MSQFIKFYLISSMLSMFRTLIHSSSRACDCFIVSPQWLCVLLSMCVGVSVWLVGVVSVWQAEAQVLSACHTDTTSIWSLILQLAMKQLSRSLAYNHTIMIIFQYINDYNYLTISFWGQRQSDLQESLKKFHMEIKSQMML